MALPLTPLGEEFVSWQPRHLQASIDVQALMDVMAREADRYGADVNDLLDQFFVITATWGLPLWEDAVKVPVNPVQDDGLGGVVPLSFAERRQIILSKLRSNIVQSAAEWRGVLDTYVQDYSIRVDHTNGVLYVRIAYNPTAYSEAQLETLIRSITPAHYNLNVIYSAFMADISAADDPL